MRHNKNNSSICQTTTLLSMSNVSAESQETSPFRNRHHDNLIEKVEELEHILSTTIAEGSLLHIRQQQLATMLAHRKATLDQMYRMPPPSEQEDNEDELAETCRMQSGWGQSKTKVNCNRTVKNHQKFYSAIQSPTISYSPQRTHDQFTLHSYQKSRYYQQSTISTKSGIIRKQRDQLRLGEMPSYRSPKQRDFESIEDIWNEGNRRQDGKPASYKGIKTFL